MDFQNSLLKIVLFKYQYNSSHRQIRKCDQCCDPWKCHNVQWPLLAYLTPMLHSFLFHMQRPFSFCFLCTAYCIFLLLKRKRKCFSCIFLSNLHEKPFSFSYHFSVFLSFFCKSLRF